MRDRESRAVRARDEDGVTLIELLVVMIIFSGLLSVVYGVLFSVQSQTATTIRRADATDQARLGLAQIDRQIRSGNVLYDPAAEVLPMSMRVYTQANGEQKCVQWQVTGGQLRTRSWASNGATYSNVSDWAVVARQLVNTNTAADTPFRLDGGGTSAYGARLVNVRLLVAAPGKTGPPLEVQSSLAGRNTMYGYDPGICNPIPPA